MSLPVCTKDGQQSNGENRGAEGKGGVPERALTEIMAAIVGVPIILIHQVKVMRAAQEEMVATREVTGEMAATKSTHALISLYLCSPGCIFIKQARTAIITG